MSIENGARDAYLASKLQSDLIAIKEAAILVDRTPATIKKWIKSGGLQGAREQPGNTKSKMLVARSELMAYVATAGKSANPGRGSSGGSGPSKAVLAAELEGQRTLVTALRAQLAMLEGQIGAIEDSRRTERERASEWKDRATVLDAELRALRMHSGLPWWRRLLTTTAEPAIPGMPAPSQAR
jgi:hypothetical protein